jgi:hypothetical protein
MCYSVFAATLARSALFGIANPEPRFSFPNCASRAPGQGVLPRIEAGWPGSLTGEPKGTSLSPSSR